MKKKISTNELSYSLVLINLRSEDFMDKNATIGTLLIEAAELLNESLLDPVNSVRCQDVFDSNDKMKPELVKVIEDNFEEGQTTETLLDIILKGR